MNWLTFFAILNSLIFFVLGGIHFYWALGGKGGLEQAVPKAFTSRFTNEETKKTYSFVTFLVGLGLTSFGVILLSNTPFLNAFDDLLPIKALTITIAIVFLLRAVGDFRYVGFFSKDTDGVFVWWDQRLYSPLCLYLGTTSLLIGIMG
ncbi:MAG: DUF3995 domain-containing protein [Bacteroidota bacterium]